MIGIYKITNKINGKVYIGQSIDIKRRWKDHRTHYKNGKYPLYFAMIKYGIENFSFEVIEECEKEKLNDREIYWISFYNSNNKNNGYNLTNGGEHCALTNIKLTEEIASQIKQMLTSSKTQEEIARLFNIDQSNVSRINTGKIFVDETISYPIRKNPSEKQEYRCIDCGVAISPKAIRCCSCNNKHNKVSTDINSNNKISKICSRISREELKQLIRTTPFTKIGKMFNVSDNAIRKWCKLYNLPFRVKDIKNYSNEEWNKI